MKLIPVLVSGLISLGVALPAHAIPEVEVVFRRGVNFRECPNVDCRIIQTFPHRFRLGYIGEAGTYFDPFNHRWRDWSHIQRRDGTTGYVVREGIRFTGQEYPYSHYPYSNY
jgi:hypothetical protein